VKKQKTRISQISPDKKRRGHSTKVKGKEKEVRGKKIKSE